MENIIENAGQEVGLSPQSMKLISARTIRQRVACGNLIGRKGSYSNITPMADVEPSLADICRQLNRMGKSLYPKEFLRLAQSMIKGTPTEKKVAAYRKLICGKEEQSNGVDKLSMKYFYSFMARHKDILRTAPVAKKDVKRLQWSSYENVQKVYDLVYEEMVSAGIAIRLEEDTYFDRDGNKTNTEEDSVGVKSKYDLIHPDYLLFVDETGSNTNITSDGKRGRSRCIAEKNCSGTRSAVATDIHFTVLGFTAATGEPVCAVVIFTSEQEESIPLNWISGIDVGLLAEEALGNLMTQEENVAGQALSDIDLMAKVRGRGKPAGGRPVCMFKGKEVPCYVQWSPHGGITPTILTNCLRYMDNLNLFPRSSELRPFILLDGHHSRFDDLQFLDYIRHEDHLWAIAFGLPYATCLWQVADSKEQNGSFKNALTIAKEKLLEVKEQLKLPLTFAPTDIIPTINYAWSNSFARNEKNCKSIFERGWNPLAYQLLADPKILRLKETTGENVNEVASTNIGAAPATTTGVSDDGQVTLNIGSGFVNTVMDIIVDSEYIKRRRMQNEANSQVVRTMLDRTKKLSSGPCYAANIVALHPDACWEHQKEYFEVRNAAEVQKKNNAKIAHFKRKKTADEIRQKEQSTWTIDEISRLLTYKKSRRNIKSFAAFGNNRELMLAEWERRKHRPTPQHSPIKELPSTATATVDDYDIVDGLLRLNNEAEMGPTEEI